MVMTRSALRTMVGDSCRAANRSASAPAEAMSDAMGGLIGSSTRAPVPALEMWTPLEPAKPPAITSRSLRSSRSAAGERQTLPVQTNSTSYAMRWSPRLVPLVIRRSLAIPKSDTLSVAIDGGRSIDRPRDVADGREQAVSKM